MIGSLVVALVLSTIAVVQRNTAQRNERRAQEQLTIANSRAVAVRALSVMETQPDLGMLLAVEAARIGPTPESIEALRLALQRSSKIVGIMRGHDDLVRATAFSPDGLLASAGDDDSVVLWDVESRTPTGQPLTGHEDAILAVAFSPDGELLASGSVDNTVIVWDPSSGEPFGDPLPGHPGQFSAIVGLAFSPDGRWLAAASGPVVTVWDPRSGDEIARLGDPSAPHAMDLSSVAFSPDGQLLAAGRGGDDAVVIWDTTTWREVGEPLIGHDDTVSALSFAPDGRTLASASWDGTAIT